MRRSVFALFLVLCLCAALPYHANEVREQRGFAPNQVYQLGELDSVNISNGDVIVRIPIGQEYSVGPTLKYQFTLVYNSKVWDYGFGAVPSDPTADQRYTIAEQHSNAGFGWIFSLGKLAIKIDHNLDKPVGWTYVAPDGAEFAFQYPLVPHENPEQKTLYAFSGRYLRLRILTVGYEVDFPDGEIHTFDKDGNLTMMRDRFGNWVKVVINGTTWTVTDGHGGVPARTHTLTFLQMPEARYPEKRNFQYRISNANLETFNGERANYTFQYAEDVNIKTRGTFDPVGCQKGPMLDAVLLPDGTEYRATYATIADERCQDWNIDDGAAIIRSLKLPTKGSIEWTHTSYATNLHACYTPTVGWETSYIGVATRTQKDHNGTVLSTTRYSPKLVDSGYNYTGKICNEDFPVKVHGPHEEFVNIVEAPDGLVTKHYFTVWPEEAPFGNPSPRGYNSDHFGLPIVPRRTYRGHLLSTEVFDCKAGCARDQWGDIILPERPIQRTYLSYGAQPLFHNNAPWSNRFIKFPFQMDGQLIETEIGEDGNGTFYKETILSEFDGYGHFQRTDTKTNNPTEMTRVSTVEQQRNISADLWLLDMYRDTTVVEGAKTTRTRSQFDFATGALKSVRTMGDPATEQNTDLLTVLCRNETTAGYRGFVTREAYAGGDKTPISGADVCNGNPPAGHFYLDHTYEFSGSKLTKHTAKWAGTTHNVQNEDFDTSSGMVKKSTDSAGLSTTFKYDILGRPTEVHPPKQAWTRYRYDRSTAPVSVHVELWPENRLDPPLDSSAGSLKDDHHFYDGLGRLTLSKSRMPGNNVWSATRTKYDNSGRVSEVYVPVNTNNPDYELVTPPHSTRNVYDILGRVTSLTTPDNSVVSFVYERQGDRVKTRTQKIWNGSADIDAVTSEEYDGFGRLVRVTEMSGENGAAVPTDYTYGFGDKLATVKINNTQQRTFTYDRRGFLQSEQHPESGLTSYTYDARGHVVTKTAAEAKYNLWFTYDPAERLINVSDSTGPLKTFTYATANGVDDYRAGKLQSATRINRPPDTTALDTPRDTVKVTETFAYRMDDARRTERTTTIESDNVIVAEFTQAEQFNELNLPHIVTYPTCEGCGVPARVAVESHYDYGRVVAVDGAIESIQYAPTGAWTERLHTNRIKDVQVPDPHGMARPASIGIEAPPVCTAISVEPEDVSITAGGSARLTVSALSSTATFTWYQGPRGDTRRPATGTILSGNGTSSIELVSVTATTSYWVRVTSNGCTEDSRTAVVDVCDLIITEPVSTIIDKGDSTTLSITAQEGVTYQWYKGLAGDTSTPVSGATSNTLTILNAQSSASYWVRVKHAATQCTDDSLAVTVTVCDVITITSPPAATSRTTVVVGDRLNYSASATGELLSYAWYKSTSSGRELIGTGPNVTFTPNAVTDGTGITISVEVSNGCTMESRTVAILDVIAQGYPCKVDMTVRPFELDSLLMPNQQSKLRATVRLKPYSDGDSDPNNDPPHFSDLKYRFRWYREGNLVNEYTFDGDKPAGATDEHLETASSGYNVALLHEDNNQTYVRLEAEILCKRGTTTVTSETEIAKSFIFLYGHCPVPEVVSEPSSAVLRLVRKTPTSTPTLEPVTLKAVSVYPWAEFKWYEGESGNTTKEVWQGEAESITVDEAGTYWVRAFSDCTYSDSPTVVVTDATKAQVCTPVRIVADPEGTNIGAFADLELSVEATGSPMPDHYVWSTGPSENIGTGQVIVISPGPRKTTDYTVRVRNDCSLVYSKPARVHVTSCADIAIQHQPEDVSIVETQLVTLNILATAVAPLRYQWYAGESGDTTSPIAGATSATLNLGAPTVSGKYWVRLSFDDQTKCEVDSRTVTVLVCAAPRITNAPANRSSIAPGLDQSFEVRAEGENLSYAWYEGALNDESKLLATHRALLVYPQKTTDYWVKVTSDCVAPQSDRTATAAFKVSVCPLFKDAGAVTASSTLVNSGQTVTLTTQVERGDTIEWFKVVGTAAPVRFAAGGPELATVTTPAITAQTKFFARATSGNCSRDSQEITVNLCSTPTVHWQHGNPTQVAKGAGFWLNAGLGAGQTANWKWYRGTASGDVPNSTLVYSTSGAYQINGLDATTTYWVRATDATTGCYSDTTAHKVNVCIPTIVTQPQSTMINSGGSATLTVVTDNLPGVSYQWYKGQPGDTSNPVGGNSNTLTVSPAATTSYWVRVTGCQTPLSPVTRDSAVATVSICQPPVITQNLTERTLARGISYTLSVTATGDGLHYQWYQGSAGITNTPVGTDSSSYTFTTSASTRYWVRITGTCGTTDSAAPLISVEPNITTHPSAGGPVPVNTTRTLTVVATGVDLTYQWYQRSGATSTIINGQTTASFTTPPITANATYYVKVCSGPACKNSNDAALQVCTSPNVRWSSGPTQVAKNETFSLTAGLNAGETASFAFYRGTVSGNVAGSTLVHSSSSVYSTSITATTSYWVRATDSGNGCYTDSTVRTVNVCIPTIVTQPQPVMINPGGSTTLSVVTDNLAGVTYQWYSGSTALTGETGSTLTVSPSATTSYWVRVAGCPSPLNPVTRDSAVATVTVCQPPNITGEPAARVLQRNVTDSISVTATGTGLHYQWYEGAAGITTTPVGTDSNTLTFTTSVTKRYWVRVTGTCGTDDSTVALISVEPQITTHPQSAPITKNETKVLNVVSNGTELTYQWYQRVGASTTLLNGQTGASFTTPAITVDSTYYVKVCSGQYCVNSNDAVLTVCQPNTFSYTQPSDVSGTAVTLSIDSAVSGETYQWYTGTAPDTSNLVGTGSSKSLWPTATTTYWVRTTRSGCTADSASRTVTICRPAITTQPAGQTVNNGTAVTLTTAATGTGTLYYQWYQGLPGNTSNPVGGNSSTLTITPSATTTYFARVTSSSTCSTRWTDTAAATITVCNYPQITEQPKADRLVKGYQYTVSVTATGDGLHYQWYKGAAGDTSQPVGFDQPSYTFTANTTTSYWVRVSGSCGPAVNSAAALQSVFPQITQQPTAWTGCGPDATFSVRGTGADTITWYRRIGTDPYEVVGTGQDLPLTLTTLPVKVYAQLRSGDATVDSFVATTNTVNPFPTLNSFTATFNSGYSYTLAASVPQAERGYVYYKFYEGALGNTSTLLRDGSLNTYTLNVYTKPKKFWVNVYFTATGCSVSRELTIQ